MLSSLFNPCEIKVHLLQNAIFIHPRERQLGSNRDEEAPPSADDELIRGLVELWVPSDRHIAGIRVRLRGVQTIGILDSATGTTPISWEETVILEKTLEIGVPPHKSIHHDKGKGKGKSRQSSPSRVEHHHNGGHITPPGENPVGNGWLQRPGGPSRGPSGMSSRSAETERGEDLPADRSGPNSPSLSRTGTAATVNSEHQQHGSGDTSPNGGGFFRLNHRERDRDHHHHHHHPEHHAGGLSGAIAAAMARGRSSSRKVVSNSASASASRNISPSRPSRNASRANSRSRPASRVGSRAASPARRSQDGPLVSNGHYEVADASSTLPPVTGSPPSAPPSGGSEQQSFTAPLPRRSMSAVPAGRGGLGSYRRANEDSELDVVAEASRRLSLNVGEPDEAASPSGHSGRGGFGNRTHGSAVRSASASIPLIGSKLERGISRGRAAKGETSGMDRSSSTSTHFDCEEDGLHLNKGVHGFEFAFIMPGDAPPYERSPYGRVRYSIKATAIGAGRARSNAEATRDIFPFVIPNPDDPLTPLTVLYNDIHPTVGLLSIACTSNSISVGGIFNVDVHSPNPPPDLIVYLVRVTLETQIELRTKRKGLQKVPTQRNKLWERGWVPPRPNDPHGPGDGHKAHGFIRDAGTANAWTVQTVARVPDDNVIRASTLPGSKADIRFSHTLLVEVVHSRDPKKMDPTTESTERKLKVFALRQPVVIPSCCTAFNAIALPQYTEHDDSERSASMPYDVGIQHIGQPGAPQTLPPTAPWASTAVPLRGSRHDFCVCGMSIADLTARERAMFPTSNNYSVPVNTVRHHGKVGEMPSAEDDAERRSIRSLTRRSMSRGERSGSVSRGNVHRSVSRSSTLDVGETIVHEGPMISADSAGDAASIGAPPSYHSVSEQDEDEHEEELRGRLPLR